MEKANHRLPTPIIALTAAALKGIASNASKPGAPLI